MKKLDASPPSPSHDLADRSHGRRKPGSARPAAWIVAGLALHLASAAAAQYGYSTEFDTNALLVEPYDIALFDPGVRVYRDYPLEMIGEQPFAFCTDQAGRIHQYRLNGKLFETYASSPDFDFSSGPYGIAVNDIPWHPNYGQVYVCGDVNGLGVIRVYEINQDRTDNSKYQRLEKKSDFLGPAAWNTLLEPRGLAVDSEGDIYVVAWDLTDSLYTVLKFDGDDVGGGQANGPLKSPFHYEIPQGNPLDVSVSPFKKQVTVISDSQIFRFDNEALGNPEVDDIPSPPPPCKQAFAGVCARDPFGDVWDAISYTAGNCWDLSLVQKRDRDVLGTEIESVPDILGESRGIEHGRSWAFTYPSGMRSTSVKRKCRSRLYVCDRNFTVPRVVVLEAPPVLSCPLPAGATAWWSFDEEQREDVNGVDQNVAFNRIDSQANGVRMPQTTQYAVRKVEGLVGSAVGSLGVEEWIEVPNHPSVDFAMDNLTIEGWVRAREESGVRAFVHKRGDHPDTNELSGYSVYLQKGNLSFQVLVGGAFGNMEDTTGPLFIADEEWHHFAIVLDQTLPSCDFYIDGVLQRSFTPPVTGDMRNSGNLDLLRHTPDSFALNGLPGELDELTFYRRPLEPVEVERIWAAGCAGKDVSGLNRH